METTTPTQIKAMVLGDDRAAGVVGGVVVEVVVEVVVAVVCEEDAVNVWLGGWTERVVDKVEEVVDVALLLFFSSHPSVEHGSKWQQPRKWFCEHV